MGWLTLPPAARPHGKAAEIALLVGAPPIELREHLDAALAKTIFDDNSPIDSEGVLDFYKRLLRLSRDDKATQRSIPTLITHLRAQPSVYPDAATAHLAVAAYLSKNQRTESLETLMALRRESVPLSVGSFDMIINAAARRRDRPAACRAYWELRRSGLTPTAYTLNAMMHTETRCGRPEAALALFRKAEGGAARRWPGSPPDAWSYSTAMAAAMAADQPSKALQLFAQVSTDEDLRDRVTPAAFNLALEARLRQGDDRGAAALLEKMTRGVGGAPSPRADTFNGMISALGARGSSYKWVLQRMAQCGVQPDSFTTCTLLRLQKDLTGSRRVWRWGRKRDAAHGAVAWHHLIEAHLRHGQPHRVGALMQLMEARDRIAPRSTRVHNLYLRALIADGRPADAISHFERMSAGADGNTAGSGGDTAAPKAEEMETTTMTRFRQRPLWLDRVPPPPDQYSFSLALTALRAVGDDVGGEDLGLSTRPSDEDDSDDGTPIITGGPGTATAGVGAAKLSRAVRAANLVQAAEARGLLPADELPPAPVAHGLITACGDDVRSAIALWRDYLRPKFVAARGRDGQPLFNPPDQQPTAEQASLHAVLRVCGAARRADEALRVVYAAKRDGCPLDVSCYTAYQRGRESVDQGGGGGGARQMLQSGYERLLALELAPERVEGPRLPGGIERIRVQFAPPARAGSDGDRER